MVQMSLTFIATLILLVFIVFYSSRGKNINYKPILVASINSFSWAAVVFLYDGYIKDLKIETYLYVLSIFEYLLILLFVRVILGKVRKNDLYQDVLKKSLSNTKYSHYYIVDDKDKIIDISDSFLFDLGLEYDDCVGKKIFDIFEKTISFTSLNDLPTTNQGIKKYYKSLNKKEETKVNAQFRNINKEIITIFIIENPVNYRGKYYGRISIAERHTEDEIFELNKNLDNKNQELSSVQSKFASTLNVIDNNLYYLDLKKGTIWVNDNTRRALDLDYNTLEISDFHSYIHVDDISQYKENLKQCIKTGKSEESYRFKITGVYTWVKEKTVISSNKEVLVGKIDLEEDMRFKKTSRNNLDRLKPIEDLLEAIERLSITNEKCEVVCFGITNMPDINERRGMYFGNTALEEYISRIQKNFLSNGESIYRIAGVDFAFILRDPRKIDILRRSLKMDDSIINLSVQYGDITETLKASMGGVEYDGKMEPKETLRRLRVALKEAKKPQTIRNFYYFEDLK